MRLELIGLNHTTSRVEVRDKAALGPDRLEETVKTLLSVHDISGVVILSTCNRTEIYISPKAHTPAGELREMFQKMTGILPEDAKSTYIYQDDDAVRHLFRVASGLDSQLLGEVQILVQVKDAYHKALDLVSSNNILNKLFTRALECGKYIRSNTGISQGAVSVASAAVQLATRVYGSLEGHKVLLVGAGETARLTAKYLIKSGVSSWRVSNRTTSNAQVVADLIGGSVVSFPPSPDDIAWADLVITATSSSDMVITAETVSSALRHNRDLKLFLDLAVPRDVDPQVRDLPNIYVYGVDDFKEMVASSLKVREQEAVRAEKLILKQVKEYVNWYNSNRISPAIQQIQEVFESIRVREIEKNIRHFNEADHEQIDLFSRSLMKKVTNHIISNLRHASTNGDDIYLAKALSKVMVSEDEDNLNEILEQLDYELSH